MTFLRISVTIMFVVLLGSILFASNLPHNVQKAIPKANIFQAENPSLNEGQILYRFTSNDSVLWNEDWETGTLGNWWTLDETDVGEKWHLDDWMAFGGSGLSWWMADTTLGTNGGYDNEWYQVIDTDPIDLTGTANPTLTFQSRWSCEPPAGATPPYNGWDGMNVRVSTDGGATWIVLQNPTPAYTATSLYSFGVSHGEGPNVPGWAAQQLTWTQVTVDLSAYAGQTVQIRFAFASDPAASTADPPSGDPSWFAWQIDNIEVADGANVLFSNDGTPTGMTPSNNVSIGGDLWHIATGVGLPSGSYFADCNDSLTGTYNPNMINSLISEYVWLPDTLSAI
nr:hypothetical protein [Fodinibius sp.]NIW44461.1 hypothetical protein [Gammaproteobacteria bacterium]NIX02229.1 hypothetical protein [Phycisphaerae bacterium]NIY24993.1 hypothetical protein [Fodinibius sp.]